jgi:hypothetical protein
VHWTKNANAKKPHQLPEKQVVRKLFNDGSSCFLVLAIAQPYGAIFFKTFIYTK